MPCTWRSSPQTFQKIQIRNRDWSMKCTGWIKWCIQKCSCQLSYCGFGLDSGYSKSPIITSSGPIVLLHRFDDYKRLTDSTSLQFCYRRRELRRENRRERVSSGWLIGDWSGRSSGGVWFAEDSRGETSLIPPWKLTSSGRRRNRLEKHFWPLRCFRQKSGQGWWRRRPMEGVMMMRLWIVDTCMDTIDT